MKTALRLALGLVMFSTSAPVLAQSHEGSAEATSTSEAGEMKTEAREEPVAELGGGSGEPASAEAAAKAEGAKKETAKRAGDDMETLRHTWTDP